MTKKALILMPGSMTKRHVGDYPCVCLFCKTRNLADATQCRQCGDPFRPATK
jgi:ribosomal protein L40E